MYKPFTLTEKTGFAIPNIYQEVDITDSNNIDFFNNFPSVLSVKQFNMPPGSYILKMGNIEKLPNPVKFTLAVLPFGERFFMPDPAKFAVSWEPNPNKCSVLWDDKKIIFDNSLRSLPQYFLYYMYFHELGHQYYSTEEYCDLFAHNCMLRYGFNPSQIKLAQNMGLSDAQSHRKKYINKVLLMNSK